ncbi:MAG: hypothetical protein H7122_03505 [Chitinophagaceae bacterium]|nr:hypothetical protein [Chitinophagaceae bacterium]
MKTSFIYLAGVFALSGFLMFENVTTGKSGGIDLPEVVADTVPNKTVYLDLNTGETIDIWYDAAGLRTLNKKTGAPVDFYVNTSTNDTVFGRGRFVVNGYVLKGDDGKWNLNDGKVKVDGDELKVKVGDQKFKIDGDEIKIKGNGVKVKSDGGDVKVKSKDGKAKYEEDRIKIKDGDNTVKVKDSTKSQ